MDVLAAAGWQVAATLPFADHHWFTPQDLAAIARTVAEHGAWGALTTDKDAVRLEPLAPPLPCAIARVPLVLDIPRWDRLTDAVGEAIARRRAQPVRPGGRRVKAFRQWLELAAVRGVRLVVRLLPAAIARALGIALGHHVLPARRAPPAGGPGQPGAVLSGAPPTASAAASPAACSSTSACC